MGSVRGIIVATINHATVGYEKEIRDTPATELFPPPAGKLAVYPVTSMWGLAGDSATATQLTRFPAHRFGFDDDWASTLLADNRHAIRIDESILEAVTWSVADMESGNLALLDSFGYAMSVQTRAELSGVAGVLRVSIPILNLDGSSALIYISITVGPMNSVGKFYSLTKNADDWKVVEEFVCWAS